MNLLSRLEISRPPVKVGHAQTYIGGLFASAHVVVGDGIDRLTFIRSLAGHYNRFGGVNTTNHHVRAGVIELIGDFGRILRYAWNVEPEADPYYVKFQICSIF